MYKSSFLVAIPNGHCRSASPVSIANTDTEGYISSYITQQTGCGNSENPWMLRVGQGQIINLTLIDFTNMRTVPQAGNEHLCAVYANVREGDGVITHTVCGGRGKKISSVFVSVTNVVEIKITSKSNQIKNDAQYLLKYTGLNIFLHLYVCNTIKSLTNGFNESFICSILNDSH